MAKWFERGREEAQRLPPDDLSQKLKEIQDKMSEALHYSIDSISALREEKRERLFEVRNRKEDSSGVERSDRRGRQGGERVPPFPRGVAFRQPLRE